MILPLLLMSACNGNFTDDFPESASDEKGNLIISLNADVRNENIDVRSSSGDEIPVDEFWVEIFTPGNKRLYCERYGQAKEDVINLNTGDYRLHATYGDSLGVGFDKPFYMADKEFVVEARNDNSVSATAKLANVKVRVIFGDNLTNPEFYSDCYALVKSADTNVKSSLKFTKDEDRAGYIPAGGLILEVYVKVGDKYMYYPVQEKTYSPNDFITLRVDADARSGNLTVAVSVDDSVEVMEDTIVISSGSVLPAAEPVISLSGFDGSGSFYLTSGVQPQANELEVDVNAPASLSSLMLEINSDYLISKGLPESVELLSPGTAAPSLEETGFVWYVNSTSTLASIDFESVAKHLAMSAVYDPSSPDVAEITVTAKDQKARKVSKTIKFIFK